MTLLADLLSTVFERRYARDGHGARDGRPLTALADDLLGTASETSGQALAAEILARFDGMDDAQKLTFFHHLAGAMNINPAKIREALDAYEESPNRATYRTFAEAAEPPRQELVRRLNRVPGATGALVRMRQDLLRLGKGIPELEAPDHDFRHLFASWFNRGFLVLRPISWESPAHILEKIIAYEAVHEIHSWADLRRRLEPPDRQCFAYFHPVMPDEPLIFVEVALTRGIPGSVQTLLAEDRQVLNTAEADTAVFYSISNCQAGLAGISFGNSLIKQVVSDLSAQVPGLKTFVTLSPIPGLMAWLERVGLPLPKDPEKLRAMAAYYLLNAKRPDGLPADPVARFHLGNGATLHALHAGADLSPRGLAQSGGTMVNYLYDERKLNKNHDNFSTRKRIAVTAELRTLAAAADPIPGKEG